jgi:surface polysaccharide O-acyltransferase-like enzyme
MTDGRGLDPLRLAEAGAQAAVTLGLTALPAAWRVLDSSLVVILAGMLAALTLGIYALHAVTFDCLRMTGHRSRARFSYTQRED